MHYELPWDMLEEKLIQKSAIAPENSEETSSTNVASSQKANTSTSSSSESNDPYTKVANWTVSEVLLWAKTAEHLSKEVIRCLQYEEIDGKVLLALCENDIRDMRYRLNYHLSFGDLKKFWLAVHGLQERYLLANATTNHLNINGNFQINGISPLVYSSVMSHNVMDATPVHRKANTDAITSNFHHSDTRDVLQSNNCNSEYVSSTIYGGDSSTPPISVDGRAINIPPEFFKTFISLGYSFLVTWITSFVMVIVHERVPDMKRYPPLPDIFLDNVPHIPWAFHMCEITGTLLFTIWLCVCIFHKYRMVLLRRFFALAGTVFLLRCVTMLITSLSVPGTHLQCDQSDYAVDDTDLSLMEALELRISRAYTIWSGLGMSIQGVRTCGDYMFSGHTVALTLLNFFITEYTPRNLYFLHTLTWLLNMFGIFFILAAHEHYSIDVFVAFYITSRLFLYYHTLANNQALMSRDSTRTRIWFPMFSYFESSVDGIIPNEFDTIGTLFEILFQWLMELKDSIMMTAQRLSVDRPQLALATKNLLVISPIPKEQRNASTSTQSNLIINSGFQSKHSLDDGNSNGEMELLDSNGIAIADHRSCNKLFKSLSSNVNNNGTSAMTAISNAATTKTKTTRNIAKENHPQTTVAARTPETIEVTATNETKKLL